MPVFEFVSHPGDPFGVLIRKILRLGLVCQEVVELWTGSIELHQELPPPLA